MSIYLILSIMFGLISAWFLISPHLAGANYILPEKENARRNSLLEEKDRLIQILRELELDFNTQKLSQDEFDRMNNELRAEFVSILKKLEESGVSNDDS